ncbi:AAA family ATPase [Nocardia flavorosea]|uniref:Gluconokinase n=2 Tax=Nocardia flavorosea TaxID=53429 RepID=A0A846YCK7_9NOCA|nr:AAA family ATPase [Nocardia flavorosea]
MKRVDVVGATPRSSLPCVVVMGVSGSGKSSTARLLALRLGVPFADADDMHPRANIVKMRSGRPLDDTDREPWLAEVGHWLRDRAADGTGGVVACSALKRRYRDSLRAAAPRIYFLLLTADRDELLARTAQRGEHFMPASLLDSQLAALELLEPDEPGTVLHGTHGPGQAADLAISSLDEVIAGEQD